MIIRLKKKSILVTGAAGFIGANLVMRLLSATDSCCIVGVDNLNDYYDVNIKKYRLNQIEEIRRGKTSSFVFFQENIENRDFLHGLFEKYEFDLVINLAAQAGVRNSITNPDAYINSNIIGFYNILEECRHSYDGGNGGVKHLVYASSSSVYGGNKNIPFSTDDKVDNPVSLYAATKKSNELMAHAYAKLYNIPSTGLRFFTVYGPAGRPDMAYFGFTDKLRNNEKIRIFNYGKCQRDFTYIDDIIEGIYRVIQKAPDKEDGADGLHIPPYKIYNIGNGNPESLLEFVNILQQELVDAGVLDSGYSFDDHKELVGMQPGDVPVTYADTIGLEQDFGYKPTTDLRTGLKKFARWYKKYYDDGLQ